LRKRFSPPPRAGEGHMRRAIRSSPRLRGEVERGARTAPTSFATEPYPPPPPPPPRPPPPPPPRGGGGGAPAPRGAAAPPRPGGRGRGGAVLRLRRRTLTFRPGWRGSPRRWCSPRRRPRQCGR